MCVCVCVCAADGKVDLKWTGNGNRRRVFLLAGRRMESSPVEGEHFILLIKRGRMCWFGAEQVLEQRFGPAELPSTHMCDVYNTADSGLINQKNNRSIYQVS